MRLGSPQPTRVIKEDHLLFTGGGANFLFCVYSVLGIIMSLRNQIPAGTGCPGEPCWNQPDHHPAGPGGLAAPSEMCLGSEPCTLFYPMLKQGGWRCPVWAEASPAERTQPAVASHVPQGWHVRWLLPASLAASALSHVHLQCRRGAIL